ncbi:restriction endonuclease subunit S [Geobacillus zalihae]|uniref:restriction endonuclease subunit S n=1 Tax=Geobacillus zalihae TaxID=213419 RepID=UPI0009BE2F73|nr:restriction endonuclease subunit S [Geobacillus zalihae]OQP16239.1 restriction endonuclease [Geobacillus zalihae]
MIRTKYKVLKLEDIAVNSKNAIVDGPFGSALKVKDYVDDGIPVLQGKNISNFQFNFSDIRYITPQKAQELIRSKVEVGDILFVKIGSIGYSAEVTDLNGYPFAIIPANLAKVSIDYSKVDKNYLLFWLRSDTVVNYLKKNASKTAQPALSLGKIKQIPVVMPSLETQKKISAVLLKAQELIDKRKAQIEALDQLTQSVFLEMFGDPMLNKKQWPKKKLGNICSIVRGGSPRPIEKFLGGHIPWIKISDATKGDSIYLKNTKEFIIEEGVKKSRLIKKGSLIFANCGVSLGFARIITFDGCIHDGWLAFEYIPNYVNKIFLLKLLNQFTDYFRKTAPDGTQPNLNTTIMKNFEVILPPIELQNRFADIVLKIESQKDLLQKSLEELENNFSSLMQQAFKGELFND